MTSRKRKASETPPERPPDGKKPRSQKRRRRKRAKTPKDKRGDAEKRLKDRLRTDQYQRKNKVQLVNTLTAVNSKRETKYGRKQKRQRDKARSSPPSNQIVKKSKTNRPLMNGKTKPVRREATTFQTPTRDQWRKRQGWIVDFTEIQKKSLAWFEAMDFGEMDHGVIVAKVPLDQITDLHDLLASEGFRYVNSLTWTRERESESTQRSESDPTFNRVHSTWRVYYKPPRKGKRESLSVAYQRNCDAHILKPEDGREVEHRKLEEIIEDLLPQVKEFGYLGRLRSWGPRWRTYDVSECVAEYHQYLFARNLAVRALRPVDSVAVTEEHINKILNQETDKDLPPIDFNQGEEDQVPVEENGYGDGTEECPNEHEKIMEIIEEKLVEMKSLSEKNLQKLREILVECIDAFGIEESMARMSELTPLKVDLVEGHQTISCKWRSIGKEQREWLAWKLQTLQTCGIIKPAKNPLYGCPVFVVPKKGPKKWRMVVDMRALNKITKRTALIMPNLEDQLNRVHGSKHFGTFDVLSGFDFLPTEEGSQKYFNLITPDGAYTMCGAPMGWLNTPAIFHERIVTEILQPAGLYEKEGQGVGALQWLDDTLLYARTFEEYLDGLKRFLKATINKKIRLSIKKCDLYGEKAEWCGRRINEVGWNFDSKFYDKILTVTRPERAWELAQAIYLCNWIGPAIPELSALREVFSDFTKGKKMKAMKRENKLVEWTPERCEAWEKLLRAVRNSSEKFLHNYDPEQELMLFTDASDEHWSLVVMQDTKENVERATAGSEVDVFELKPKPMMFLSGKFTKSEMNWHVSHKEMYPIVHAFKRLNYLLLGHPGKVKVFTDHKNLKDILRPQTADHASHSTRLHRWALTFQEANIRVYHVPGEQNFLADLMTRWGAKDPDKVDAKAIPGRQPEEAAESVETAAKHIEQQAVLNARRIVIEPAETTVRRVETRRQKKRKRGDRYLEQLKELDEGRVSFTSPLFQGRFLKLTEAEILEAQKKDLPEKYKPKGEELAKRKGKIIIPESIVTRFLLHNHVAELHPSFAQEKKTVLQRYHFQLSEGTKVETLLQRLRNRCLHCDRHPKLLRTPLNITELAEKPNEILHSDYLYVNKHGYILTLVDSLSRKTYLKYCPAPTAEHVVDALLDWRAAFNLNKDFVLVSDNGSHFANKILKDLQKRLNYAHRFSIAYSPWTNGAAERINSDILQSMRTLMSEYGLHESEWPRLLTSITYAINNKPLPTRQNLTANEIFLGRSAEPDLFEARNWPLLSRDKSKLVEPQTSYEKIAREFAEKRDEIAEKVAKFVELKRNQNNRNKRRHQVTCVQYSVGDWVMISKAGTPREKISKTKKAWGGPMQVTKIVSDNVYKVRDLLNKEHIVHAARMWFYDGTDFVPNERLQELFVSDWGELEVRELRSLRKEGGHFEIETFWLGFEEPTWETIPHLDQFIPNSVTDFLEEGKRQTRETRLFTQAIRSREPRADHLEDHDPVVGRIQLEGNTEGWEPEEDEILRSCMAKFGVGRFHNIQQNSYLPFRSRQQLSTRMKTLLGTQSYETFVGIHCWADKVKQYNKERYGTDFYKNPTGIRVSEAVRDMEWTENKRRFEIPMSERTSIKIPYYRRSDHLGHLELKVNEGVQPLTADERESLREERIAKEKRLADFIDYKTRFLQHIQQIMGNFPDIPPGYGKNGERYLIFQQERDSTDFLAVLVCFEGTKDWTDPLEINRIGCKTFDPLVRTNNPKISHRLFIVATQGIEKVVAERANTNEYIVTSNLHGKEQIVVHIRPSNARPFPMTLDKRTVADLIEREGTFDVLIADPPWDIAAGKDPTRGVRLTYDTMDVRDIFMMGWPNLVQKGVIFLWVVQKTLMNSIKFMKEFGFELAEELVWMKLSNKGTLTRSYGHFFQRAKEHCLMFVKNIPSIECATSFSDTIRARRRVQSQKPDQVHIMAETLFPNGRFIELFARNNNLRRGWVSVGNQVSTADIVLSDELNQTSSA